MRVCTDRPPSRSPRSLAICEAAAVTGLAERCQKVLAGSWNAGEHDGVAALSPLGLPDLPDEIGHRLAEYLLDEQRFWTEVPVPSVALGEPSFSLRERFDGLRRYWRGPTWINSAWLLWRGLVRPGYEEDAATLARAITETVSREGLREFYDPHDGRGMGAGDFAWSALALELLDPGNASLGG